MARGSPLGRYFFLNFRAHSPFGGAFIVTSVSRNHRFCCCCCCSYFSHRCNHRACICVSNFIEQDHLFFPRVNSTLTSPVPHRNSLGDLQYRLFLSAIYFAVGTSEHCGQQCLKVSQQMLSVNNIHEFLLGVGQGMKLLGGEECTYLNITDNLQFNQAGFLIWYLVASLLMFQLLSILINN